MRYRANTSRLFAGTARAVEWLKSCSVGARVDPSAVADGIGVAPVLVDIAVENLAPITSAGKADSIVEAIEIPKVHVHDHVVACSLNPAVKCEYAILKSWTCTTRKPWPRKPGSRQRSLMSFRVKRT